MREYTLSEYRQIDNDEKGIFTPDAKYPWKHTITDGKKSLVEGIDFRIVPTSAELDAVAKQMLDNIDKEKVRGYHPWYFSGSFEVDDNTLLIAETREDRYLDVSIWYFEPSPKLTSLRTVPAGAIIKRVCAYNQKALVKRLERLFYLMGHL